MTTSIASAPNGACRLEGLDGDRLTHRCVLGIQNEKWRFRLRGDDAEEGVGGVSERCVACS